MEIVRYEGRESVDAALAGGEPLLAVVSFDGKKAIVGHIDECMEHHILLSKAGFPSTDIDRYFRIVFDREGADWTFVCPPDYRGIGDKTRRIAQFYRDGFAVISDFLAQMGYLVDIKIPKRYQRHIKSMGQEAREAK